MARILLIEDEAQHIMLVKMRLQANGFEFAAAQTGADGLREAASFRPDLILMDLILPDMEPAKLIRALRSAPSTARTPIVAISAMDNFELYGRRLTGALAGFIQKPYETSELLSTINMVLDGSRGEGE